MQRKNHSAEFKAKVALELVKGHSTLSEVASNYGVHPNMITKWKKQLLEQLPDIFSSNKQKKEKGQEELVSTLYQQIGQLKVEVDWLRKKSVTLR